MNTILNKKLSIIFLIWQILDKRRRRQVILIQFLNLLCIVSEVLNLITIKFFLDGLINREYFQSFFFINIFLKNLNQNNQFILIGIITIFIILITSLLRVMVIFFQNRIAALLSVDIATIAYNNIISRKYSWHIQNNTSLVLGLLSNDVEKVRESINNFFALLINFFLILFIGFPLFLMAPGLVFVIVMFVFILFLSIYRKSRTSLIKDGISATKSYQSGLKIISESLGSIKDILINRRKVFFLKNYLDKFIKYSISIGNLQYRYQSPRFLVEGILLSIIVISSIFLNFTRYSDQLNISIVSIVFIGIYKLLIPFQQCSSAISSLKSNKASWERIKPYIKLSAKINISSKNLKSYKNHESFKFIKLENVSFKYKKKSKWIIRDFNLKINKGQKIGIMGYSGFGKSTCGDLISGLLIPNLGKVLFNGKDINTSKRNFENWHRHISIVPQNVYLIEDTFINNIAFGVPSEEIDLKRVIEVSKKAFLHETIMGFRNGYNEIVGEKANKLSGGQIQRLAIARALYKKAEFMIFDEATSALDNKTESKLIESLNNFEKELTIIFITHRLSTVKNCDFLVFFDKDGSIIIGKTDDLLKKKNFKNLLNQEKDFNIK